jgi:peptide-methionine (S)-S-oxide reductase
MKYLLILVMTAVAIGAMFTLAPRGNPPEWGNPSLGQKVDSMKTKTATFAAGCFWGIESSFRKVNGVVKTEVGYTGGHTQNPTYHDVCDDTTGHAEAVRVTYDPTKVSYAELLDAFWSSHDPTTVDRQGPDIGSQYRSAIFFHDAEQEQTARASLKEVGDSRVFRRPIVTEVVAAGQFYPAEEYHQQYFEKAGYGQQCHVGPATVHTHLAADSARQRHDATMPPVTQNSQ